MRQAEGLQTMTKCDIIINGQVNGYTVPKKCNGDIVEQGKGPDLVKHCMGCGAKWTMDGKEGKHVSYSKQDFRCINGT